MPRTFYEFFAGGGMSRYGLGSGWRCLFANDIDDKKAECYRANFAGEELTVRDVSSLKAADLPGTADLAWASFPCQDLSLAGNGAGLRGNRSGTFWPFWRLIEDLCDEDRAPGIVVLENVCGTLRSHGGRDFASIADALAETGYRIGALVVDAVQFLPQSRPRLFIVGAFKSVQIHQGLSKAVPDERWTPQALNEAHSKLSSETARRWVWWTLPGPRSARRRFSDLVEENPAGINWHSQSETQRLLGLMSSLNRAKVDAKKRESKRTALPVVGTIYRRTREDEAGKKQQRAEVRFDEIAGCLRTPAGGSSRQTILVIEGDRIRSRLLSPREAARLMGLPEDYKLPERYNDAYQVAGDGVAVPVVRHLAEHLLEPLLPLSGESSKAASREHARSHTIGLT
ncbi:MAG: DNA cytosine methyltransferase [Candidatus Binataceae bacterium]